jgi:hypothetical protein
MVSTEINISSLLGLWEFVCDQTAAMICDPVTPNCNTESVNCLHSDPVRTANNTEHLFNAIAFVLPVKMPSRTPTPHSAVTLRLPL